MGLLVGVVLLSYGAAVSQVPEVVKDAAGKTKDVTVDTAKKVKDVTVDTANKTKVVVSDGLDTAADKTAGAAKKAATTSKRIGNYTVDKTENVVGHAYEGGKHYTVKSWDGTKWVSKRVWYKTKQGADATKDAVVGDGEKKP
jgi:hypothetical protein